jgi:hypothetical protein
MKVYDDGDNVYMLMDRYLNPIIYQLTNIRQLKLPDIFFSRDIFHHRDR